MRRSSTIASLLLLILNAASSPVQPLHTGRDSPPSGWESLQQWNPMPHLFQIRDVADETADDILGLDKRYTYDCTDLKAAFDSRCWAELDLTAYLTDPVTGWNHTTRTCDSAETAQSDDGADCCKPGEPWSTCYLRLAHGSPGQDCSQINGQFCSYQSTLDPNIAPALKPKVQYMMKNIYSVNNFFTTYYQALGAAQADAQTVIQSLVNELDPVKPVKFSLLTLLTALSVGLAFLGAPSIAVAVLGLSLVTRTAAQVLTISLQQAPSTAKALWPSGTQNSQNIQVGNVESELGNSTNQLAAMINNAVQLLMSDVPTFVHFCESGMWSGSTSLSLPSKVEGLDYALRTYMTSEVMAQNGWMAFPTAGPYETLNDVENNVEGGTGFNCQMGNNSVCTNTAGSAFYWSLATGHVYRFWNKDIQTTVSPYQVLQDTVNNNWAILEVLFDGSFNCTLGGNFGNSVVNFNWDGTLNIACISQLPMKVNCGGGCPVGLVNGACPFVSDNNPCFSSIT